MMVRLNKHVLIACLMLCSMVALGSHTLLAGSQRPDYVFDSQKVNMLSTPQPAPNVVFMDMQGNKVSLQQFRGTVVMLNFWAPWCAPCVQEMPAFDQLQAQYGPQGLRILSLAQGQGKSTRALAAEIQQFYQQQNIRNLPIFMDQVADAYSKMNAVGLPTTIVIDKRGYERMRVAGVIEWQSAQYRQWLESLLAE